MTNYEYLLQEKPDIVKECLMSAQSIHIDKYTGEIGKCYRGDKCDRCNFKNIEKCYGKLTLWLEEEYRPIPEWEIKGNMARCTSCGFEVTTKSAYIYKFCPNCGERLVRETKEEIDARELAEEEVEKKERYHNNLEVI